MRKLAIVTFLVLATTTFGQRGRKDLYTRPKIPSREVLERLNLKMNWRTKIPMESKKDGIYSFQFAWFYENKNWYLDLLVQTRRGLIVAIDSESGEQIWRVQVGNPYKVTQPLGVNNQTIVAIREGFLYGIDRKTGRTTWKLTLPSTPTTPPAVDEKHIYLAIDTRKIQTYALPTLRQRDPVLAWEYRTTVPLEQQPLLLRNFLIMSSVRGSVLVMFKDVPKVFRQVQTEGTLLTLPAIHPQSSSVYVGADDATVYAETAEPQLGVKPWRFSAGGAIIRSPVVTDDDVFVTAARNGLFRVRRLTLSADELSLFLIRRGLVSAARLDAIKKGLGAAAGDARAVLRELERRGFLSDAQTRDLPWQGGDPVWQRKEADRVLAANPKFIYAVDRRGFMLVLDRERGTKLSRYNIRDWVVPITNEWTDRIYLAAHNGQIISLQDRQYPRTIQMKVPLEPAQPKAPAPR